MSTPQSYVDRIKASLREVRLELEHCAVSRERRRNLNTALARVEDVLAEVETELRVREGVWGGGELR